MTTHMEKEAYEEKARETYEGLLAAVKAHPTARPNRFQWRCARALGREFGHAWADVPMHDEEPRTIQEIEALSTGHMLGLRATGVAFSPEALSRPFHAPSPAVRAEDGDLFLWHETASGRHEWRIEESLVSISVNRPGGEVLEVQLRDADGRLSICCLEFSPGSPGSGPQWGVRHYRALERMYSALVSEYNKITRREAEDELMTIMARHGALACMKACPA